MSLSKRLAPCQRILRSILTAVLLTTGLCACSWLPDKIDPTESWSASQLYSEAKDELNSGNYETAIKYFEKLQARYPFGRYAQQAQLELIYAYYKSDEPDAAIAAADRFIRTYPRNPFVDYAYYLKGIVNFSRNTSLTDRIFPNDPSETDTSATLQSFNDFSELVRKFPQSKYAEDARQRMLFLRNNLAAYEVRVADYYIRRKAYVAAVNRAKYVLMIYPRTPAVADALAAMTRAYVAMDMMDLAQDSLRVLTLNHPDSTAIPELLALVNGTPPPRKSFSLFAKGF
jgi:outer membrane protein assembly factor BamD